MCHTLGSVNCTTNDHRSAVAVDCSSETQVGGSNTVWFYVGIDLYNYADVLDVKKNCTFDTLTMTYIYIPIKRVSGSGAVLYTHM